MANNGTHGKLVATVSVEGVASFQKLLSVHQ